MMTQCPSLLPSNLGWVGVKREYLPQASSVGGAANSARL